jgi:hypothetical protein
VIAIRPSVEADARVVSAALELAGALIATRRARKNERPHDRIIGGTQSMVVM